MADIPAPLSAALADRYAIDHEVGAGGMATVYLAEDLKHRRKVALKVLRPELAAALGPERFVREIEIAAQLSHPHILPLYDSGEAGGFLYYVMPFVAGESLRDKLARERELPVPEAVRILRDVADALAKAHSQGVVHRDIKPDNIMLADRHALVTDFGVAKAVSEATSREGLTTAGVTLGTPAYMAPEQASADPNVDHRADIYALGVVAYELLAGRPPFVAQTAQAVLAAHVMQTPDPITDHRALVPPALSELVMRCLAKKPADRWQSADELLQRLEALTTPSGGITLTDTRPVRAERRASRKGIGVAVALVALTAAGVFTVTRSGRVPEDPRRSLIVFPFDNQTGDPDLDWLQAASLNALALNLAHWEDLRVYDEERTASLMRRRAVEPGNVDFDAAQQMAREAGVGTLVLGELRREGDSLVFDAKVHDVASGERIAREIVRSAATADPRTVFDSLGGLVLNLSGAPPGERPGLLQQTTTSTAAYRAYLAGMTALQRLEYDSSEAHLRRAIVLDSTFALGYLKLAWVLLWRQSQLPAADSAAREALGAERGDLIAQARRYSGALPARFRSFVDYFAAYREGRMVRARAITERLIQQDSTDAEAWYQLGEAHFHNGSQVYPHSDTLGNLGKALRAFERTLALDSGYILAYMHTLQALTACTDRPLNGTVATVLGGGWVCLADSAVYGSRAELEQAIGKATIGRVARELKEEQVRVAYGWVAALPQAAGPRERLVEVLLARKRYAEAERQLDELRNLGLPVAPTDEVKLFLGTGRYQEAAERAVDALATANPARINAQFQWLGAALLSAGRADKLAELFAKFLAALPDTIRLPPMLNVQPIPKSFLARQLRAQGLAFGDPAAATEPWAALLDDLQATFPRDTNTWVYLVSGEAGIVTDSTLLSRMLRVLPADSAPVGRARLALARGDTAAAVRLRRDRYDATATKPIENGQAFGDTYAWAAVIAAMGDLRGALTAYARLDSADFDFDGAAVIVRSWPERAALYQQLGDTRRAIELYERFIDAWRDASPELQPLVDRARAAVAALRGETTGAPKR